MKRLKTGNCGGDDTGAASRSQALAFLLATAVLPTTGCGQAPCDEEGHNEAGRPQLAWAARQRRTTPQYLLVPQRCMVSASIGGCPRVGGWFLLLPKESAPFRSIHGYHCGMVAPRTDIMLGDRLPNGVYQTRKYEQWQEEQTD